MALPKKKRPLYLSRQIFLFIFVVDFLWQFILHSCGYFYLLLQFEIREDEEQAEKQQEIIDLLLAAGYFRARIKGLTIFDKVIIVHML